MVNVRNITDDEIDNELPVEVEQRLARLEAAVNALQDTPLMEERVAERVIQRLKKTPIKALRDSVDVSADAKEVVTATADDEAIISGNSPVVTEPTNRRGWFLFDLLGEFRTIGQMTFDHRYRFSWIGRIGPVVIAVVYVFLWLLIGGSGLLGIFERLFDIVLVIMLYHILAREARLYRSRQL